MMLISGCEREDAVFSCRLRRRHIVCGSGGTRTADAVVFNILCRMGPGR